MKTTDFGGIIKRKTIRRIAAVLSALTVFAALSVSGCMAEKADAKSRIIVLDPGHDALHTGCRYQGATEEDLALKIAKYCREALEREGFTVYLTREKADCVDALPDTTIDGLRRCLGARVDYAVSKKAAVMVSLHLNADEQHNSSGAMVMVPNASYDRMVYLKGRNLARNILSELEALGIQNQGLVEKESTEGYQNPDGSTADYYKIIRDGKAAGLPVVIVEHAFLDSRSDYEAFLNTEEKLRALGEADARGIMAYFK